MEKYLKRARHDYIRYANCWEDADILIEALDPQPGAKILSVGSAGDNSFALLANDPDKVVAVDINPVQCKLIEIKKAAIKAFDRDTFLKFLGFEDASNRQQLFRDLKQISDKQTFLYWDDRFQMIENGLIRSGKFERYFNVFAHKILPLIHSEERVKTLFLKKTEEEQERYFKMKWNNLRWRLLFKIFFSKFILGRFGRSKAFMNEVKINVSDFIFRKATNHLSSDLCQNNYFLNFILTGNFNLGLPYYARKENYNQIKANIDKLEIKQALVEDCLNSDSYYTHINLSNVFEYMSPDIFESVADRIYKNTAKETKFAYWNLMVDRKLSDTFNDKFRSDEELSKRLSLKDKGFFYDKLITEERL